MTAKTITINDIASRLNVSPSTVSRALSGNSRISKKTREAVLKAAEELDYRPNIIASSLRKGKGRTVGVVVPQINRYFFSTIIQSIEAALSERDFNLLICQSSESYEKEVASLNLLREHRVDGILVAVSVNTRSTDHLEMVHRSGMPLIQFDRMLKSGFQTSSFINDNRRGAYECISHLVEQGYRKIAHLRPTVAEGFQ